MSDDILREFNKFVNQHQDHAYSFPKEDRLLVLCLGLAGETGEVLEIIKKRVRGQSIPGDHEALKLELGDVIHYAVALINYHGFTIEEVMAANMAKLNQRHGKGD